MATLSLELPPARQRKSASQHRPSTSKTATQREPQDARISGVESRAMRGDWTATTMGSPASRRERADGAHSTDGDKPDIAVTPETAMEKKASSGKSVITRRGGAVLFS